MLAVAFQLFENFPGGGDVSLLSLAASLILTIAGAQIIVYTRMVCKTETYLKLSIFGIIFLLNVFMAPPEYSRAGLRNSLQ